MKPRVQLKSGGKQYDGWETARVTRGIESIAGGFELSCSNTATIPLQQGSECSIVLPRVGAEDLVLITGYVDKREYRLGPNENSISISGRDRTGLLVDCSALPKVWELHHTHLLDLVKLLCEPFGISVYMDPALNAALALKTHKATGRVSGAGKAGKRSGMGVPGAPAKFSIDPGESAFEVIDRACRMAGVLPVSDGQGGLMITRGSAAIRSATPLTEGINILSGSSSWDSSTRYYKYIVASQRQATDEDYGPSVAGVTGVAFDNDVGRRNRVLIVRPEASATPASAKARAGWEATARLGRSASASVTVRGWTQNDGSLWAPNMLIAVQAPSLGLIGAGPTQAGQPGASGFPTQDMLLTEVAFTVDDASGMTAQLTLRPPGAFTPEPVNSTQGAAAWKELARGAL